MKVLCQCSGICFWNVFGREREEAVPCNTVLCVLPWLEHMDVAVMLDNEAMYDVSRRTLGIEPSSCTNLNHLVESGTCTCLKPYALRPPEYGSPLQVLRQHQKNSPRTAPRHRQQTWTSEEAVESSLVHLDHLGAKRHHHNGKHHTQRDPSTILGRSPHRRATSRPLPRALATP